MFEKSVQMKICASTTGDKLNRRRINLHKMDFIIVVFTRHFWDDQVKDDRVTRACSMYQSDVECISNFSWRI